MSKVVEPQFYLLSAAPRASELVIQSGPNTLRLTTNGKENLNDQRIGQHKSTTRWNGSKLVTGWKIERGGQVFMEGSDVRYLDRDGKTLIQDSTVLEGISTVAAGLGIGLAGALLFTRVLRSLLYDVAPTDPSTYFGVVSVLVFAALISAYIPARRAGKVSPMEVLRNE